MYGKKKELKDLVTGESRADMEEAGMELKEGMRSGSFLQEDGHIVLSDSLTGDVEIAPMEEAVEKYDEVRGLYGKAFKRADKDTPSDTVGGYFIRIKKGAQVQLPIQACLYLKSKGFEQRVRNLILVEEGASVYMITGCSASKSALESTHLGLSEFFVKKGGYLNFTMVHAWREEIKVRPVSVALVEDEGTFISNYVCMRPVSDIKMYPTAFLDGDSSKASFNSLIVSHPGTLQDIGSRVIFNGKDSNAEIISRAVSYGGKVIARGHLKAGSAGARGHLECRGLVVSEKGSIHAIPELETDLRDVELSHEAAIGRISREEIEYLCARGMTPEEAQSVIIRGFMDVDALSLPEALRDEIRKLEDKSLKEGM
jgi:Fe-S cluster assembly scaffold protein SufB